MNDPKPWWASKTIWAGIAALVLGVLNSLHYALDADLSASLADWLQAVGEILAGAVAIGGRIAATRKIGAAQQGQSSLRAAPPMLLAGGLILALLGSACAALSRPSIAADAARRDALAAVIADHVAAHPEQAGQWRQFSADWAATTQPVAVEEDAARRAALSPLVDEWVARHPDQAQSWSNLMRAWERSINARRNNWR